MRRTFILNLALVLVLNLLVKPFYIFGIDAEVQVRAGTEAYGSYAALLSLSFLLNILLDLGMTNWNTRHIAANTTEMRSHVSGILPVRGLLAILYAVVIFLVAVALGYSGWRLKLLAILVLNQFLVATVLYLRSNIAGAQRFAQDSLMSVLDRLLLIGIIGYVLWIGPMRHEPFRIEWFAWAQTAAYGVTALVCFILVSRLGGVPWPRLDRSFSRSVLKESFPFALLVLLMSFYYRTDTVMLERMLPDGALQAGIYAQGFRFFEAFNMLGFLLAGLLLPMFSRMLALQQNIGPLTGLATRLVLVGAVTLALVGSFYAKDVMDLRYHEHTEASAPAFALLVWSFVAVCLTYVYGTLLTASGDLRSMNIMAACGMVFNIGLNLVLIPQYKVMGAAVAGATTQALMAVVQMIIAQRRFGLKAGRRDVLRLTGFLVALVALALGLHRSGVVLLLAAPIMGSVALVAAFASGLFSLQQVRSLLASKRPG